MNNLQFATITETGSKKHPFKMTLKPKLAYVMRKYFNYALTSWKFKTESEAYKSYYNDLYKAQSIGKCTN